VLGWTRTSLQVAAKLAGEGGYAGRWLLAVGMTRLHGRFASIAADHAVVGFPAFSDDEYIQATESLTVELLDRPGAVVARLLRRLLRATRERAKDFETWFQE
jgi:hypothetical protein